MGERAHPGLQLGVSVEGLVDKEERGRVGSPRGGRRGQRYERRARRGGRRRCEREDVQGRGGHCAKGVGERLVGVGRWEWRCVWVGVGVKAGGVVVRLGV